MKIEPPPPDQQRPRTLPSRRARPAPAGSATDRARRHRRRLFSTLALGVLLPGYLTAAAAQVAFERHEVVTGSAPRQTVLTGFLLDGAMADLAVVHLDENDVRRLRIYAHGDGAWAPRLDATLRPGVLYVDVADIGGRDRLVTYERGRLNWFDPESGTERELVKVPSDFDPPPRGEISHVDVTRDLNADDRDDLVVPDRDGFWVFVQTDDGAFADPVKVGLAIELGMSAGSEGYRAATDGYRYDPWSHSRVHEIDYDGDGRGDLAYWNGDHFAVHRQDAGGRFATAAETFTTEAEFDSDGLYSLVHEASGDEWKVLHSLDDLNGDGVADLVAFSLPGASHRVTWSKAKSLVLSSPTYEVHFGALEPGGGTAFTAGVGTAIRSDGVQMAMEQHDFDYDGQIDVMFTNGRFSVPKLFGALLTGSVPLDLEFYRMEAGVYPDQPNARRRIRAASPPWWRGKVYPSVLIGDVNGDRRADLLVQNGRQQLHVFAGVPGPDLFAPRPLEVTVAMPADEEYTWLVDLDKNGKQDVLMHHSSSDEPGRVTMLVAR